MSESIKVSRNSCFVEGHAFDGNTLPSHYEAKKILCPMEMEYKRYMHIQRLHIIQEKV